MIGFKQCTVPTLYFPSVGPTAPLQFNTFLEHWLRCPNHALLSASVSLLRHPAPSTLLRVAAPLRVVRCVGCCRSWAADSRNWPSRLAPAFREGQHYLSLSLWPRLWEAPYGPQRVFGPLRSQGRVPLWSCCTRVETHSCGWLSPSVGGCALANRSKSAG